MKVSAGCSYEQLKGETRPLQSFRDDHGTVNPFYYRPAMTRMDWVKVIINTFWLFPLRLFLIIIPSFCLGVLLCAIVIIGDTLDQRDPRPLRGWRRFVINELGRRVDRVLMFGCGFHWITVTGSPATPDQAPVMVASPHSSILDMTIISIFHLPTFVAKKETGSVPILGYLVTHTMRAIFVARDNPESRKECTDEIIRRAKDPGAGWPKILIFPEATTHSRQVLLQFKKGAFLPRVPVQAVVLKYQNRLNSMIWSDRGIGLITALYITVCQFHNSLEVEFLPVHQPSPSEITDPGLFAENVRGEVSMATGIPCSNYSVEDLLLCRSSRKSGLPFRTGLVSFSSLHQQFQLTLPQVKRRLEIFSEMDTDKDGYITITDFCHYFGLANDVCTQTVFSSLSNQAEDGRVSFRQYINEVSRQTASFLTDQSLLQMFQFFDTENKGRITISDINTKLHLKLKLNNLQTKDGSSSSIAIDLNQGATVDHTHNQLLPPDMDYDKFCQVMEQYCEYLLIFHHCQQSTTASSSVTKGNSSNSYHDNTTTVELHVES